MTSDFQDGSHDVNYSMKKPKAKTPFISNQTSLKPGSIVIQVNMHQLMESDF